MVKPKIRSFSKKQVISKGFDLTIRIALDREIARALSVKRSSSPHATGQRPNPGRNGGRKRKPMHAGMRNRVLSPPTLPIETKSL
jgi:hypothetical protein